MQGNDYIFCFQDSKYNFWKVDDTGMVSKTAAPYFLDFAPSGWEEINIQNVRNKKYWGIDRSVTIPLSYVRDAATILKYIFYTQGIEESVYLVIASQRLDYVANVSYSFWYKQIFRGEVDLSEFQHMGSKVTASTLEDGLAKFLKANEATVFEFPMNVPEAIRVKMDGINLHEKLIYQAINQLDISKGFYGNNFFAPVSFITNEGDSVGISTQSQTLLAIGGTWDDKRASDNYMIRNLGSNPVTIAISGKIEFTCTGMVSSPAYAVKFRFITSTMPIDPPNQDRYKIIETGAMTVGQTYSADFAFNITLAANEKLFLEGIFFGGSGSDVTIQFTENNDYKIAFITRNDPTFIRALPPQYLFDQLVNKVTEENYKAALSAYFELNKNKVFTSGNAIRGLEDATIKINLNDFFKFWDSFDAVGISESRKQINFDKKENLIDADNTIVLPEPASGSFKVSVAKDYLFNELQIGYPEIKNDVGVLNGNEEFNTKFIFSLGTTKSPAVLDKISPIKTSCYEIEKIRVTTLDKETTDYKADNDVFALAIEEEEQPAITIPLPFGGSLSIPGYYNLDRSLNATATGLLEPGTVFNIPFSPKRMLLNNGSFIRSSLYLSDTKTLKFISADKNDKMVAGGLVEKAGVNVGNLGAKFFNPVLIDMEIPAPDDLDDLLDANPTQLFEFPFQGAAYSGLLQKVSSATSNKKLQSYQLLSYSFNNLQNLIEYDGQ